MLIQEEGGQKVCSRVDVQDRNLRQAQLQFQTVLSTIDKMGSVTREKSLLSLSGVSFYISSSSSSAKDHNWVIHVCVWFAYQMLSPMMMMAGAYVVVAAVVVVVVAGASSLPRHLMSRPCDVQESSRTTLPSLDCSKIFSLPRFSPLLH